MENEVIDLNFDELEVQSFATTAENSQEELITTTSTCGGSCTSCINCC